MAKMKLTYFDFHGGRGEPARLALSIGGIVFEDDRVAPSDWERRKGDTPFGALPVLEVDGQIVAQSNAINRYAGKLAALYPSDPWQAALCDEAIEAVEDEAPVDAMISLNMVHIAPWEAALGLLAGAGRLLKPDGVLVLYGPFMLGGTHTAASNAAFDADLKRRDPRWGVRDVDDLVDAAAPHGLELLELVEMPANNLSLVFVNAGPAVPA
jgi:glutathione S-transferase